MGDFDDARAERDYRMNPPESAPGQGFGDDGWGGSFSQPLGGGMDNSSPFMGGGTDINSILNGAGGSPPMPGVAPGGAGGMPGAGVPQQPKKAAEDVFFDIAMVTGKGVGKFTSDFVSSFSGSTADDWLKLGDRICRISAITAGVGLLLSFLGLFAPSIQQPSDITIGGAMGAIVGLPILFYGKKRKKTEPSVGSTPVKEAVDFGFDGSAEDGFSDDSFDNDSFGEEYEEYEDGYEYDEEPEEDFGDGLFEDDGISWDDDDISGAASLFDEPLTEGMVGSDDFSVDDAIDKVQDIPQGTYTRQYLFETFLQVLPRIDPGYADMEMLDDYSDEFMMFSEYLIGAAEQVGTKEENIPELLEVRKGRFIIQLKATRPSGLKEQDIANELADRYSRDDDNVVVRNGVYAMVDSTIGVYIINIFTGESARASLADIFTNVKDYILDVSNKMPFVWGISEKGRPYYCDLVDCESMIITGETRSGKSWKGQSLVAQLAMFNSPKDVHMYFFDPKGSASDYAHPARVLPHARYFCGIVSKVNEGLRKVIDLVNNTVGKTLSDTGFINIKDYNRNHPEDKLPFTYVIIDELVSLTKAMDKEENAEFSKLTATIVSKMPYLGIRLVMFPHRITNNIISKDVYAIVSSRAIAGALSEEMIKSALGVGFRDFPYKLTNPGDMGIITKQVEKGKPVFCHGEMLTATNEGNKELFTFIGAVWRKLEPDYGCIDIRVIPGEGAIGGKIGKFYADPGESKNKVVHLAKDNTAGKEQYQYSGFDTGSSLEELEKSGAFGEEPDQSEESFWENLLDD